MAVGDSDHAAQSLCACSKKLYVTHRRVLQAADAMLQEIHFSSFFGPAGAEPQKHNIYLKRWFKPSTPHCSCALPSHILWTPVYTFGYMWGHQTGSHRRKVNKGVLFVSVPTPPSCDSDREAHMDLERNLMCMTHQFHE